jgi:hypothetical protein
LAKWLEPKAVKQASLITGVAEGYYQSVIERNPSLRTSCVFGAMPYGGEATDHERLKELQLKPYLFQKNKKLQMLYAGAMLPKAYGPLEAIFQSISENKKLFNDVEFHFIGTGKLANDANSHTIKPLAEKYGLWQTVVFEYPKRIPYMDVLIHLDAADAVFILGSTEPHYTPSKSYQAVLSGKPVLAVLHSESTAVQVLEQSGAGIVLSFKGESELSKIQSSFAEKWNEFKMFSENFRASSVNKVVFERYSAKAVTEQLAALLDSLF